MSPDLSMHPKNTVGIEPGTNKLISTGSNAYQYFLCWIDGLFSSSAHIALSVFYYKILKLIIDMLV